MMKKRKELHVQSISMLLKHAKCITEVAARCSVRRLLLKHFNWY